jgi:ribosomal protein S18 acetylase RimI-like enzyme
MAITHALLDAVEAWWQQQAVDGTLITWPAVDGWLAVLLTQRGYVADSAAAVRPLDPLMLLPAAAGFTIRQAQPEDEEILVALHLEEIRFHEAHTPYSRVVPAIEPAFRQRLARVERVEDGAPLLLVAEQAGQVVGFTENWLSEMKGSWFPNGRYAYLNSVGVSEAARGQGIGRLLVAHTLHALAQYDIAGFYLYYVLTNPVSSHFWPKMGFRPLLSTYKTMKIPNARSS